MTMFIILSVFVVCGLFAGVEIIRNLTSKSARHRGMRNTEGPAPVIYLPVDIEKEKRRRNII